MKVKGYLRQEADLTCQAGSECANVSVAGHTLKSLARSLIRRFSLSVTAIVVGW
ncbi:MAG: hypothetical protein J2P27_12320 [Actinobacteria bacterium]|nr:hypothetical protein [Actinomycetota bacterium]